MTWLLAHGIGGIRDLPVPGYVFFYGAAGVLVVSFAALAFLWRKPVLAARRDGRPLPAGLQRVLLSRGLRVVVGALMVALLVFLWLGALVGKNSSGVNFTPTFVYVYFWIGHAADRPPCSGTCGRCCHPWKAAAEGVGWLAGRRAPPFVYPERLGRWPAAVMLLSFAAMELTYPDPPDPHALALAIAIYSVITWGGAIAFGSGPWFRYGDGFSNYFGMLSRISPLARRDDGQLVIRWPLTGLSITDATPGTIAFVAVMLGTTFFDGFSRTSIWQNRYYQVQVDLLDRPNLADLLGQLMSVGGMIACVAFVGLAFRLAVAGTESIANRRPLSPDFIDSLIPIALVYVIAHYFSLLYFQGRSDGSLPPTRGGAAGTCSARTISPDEVLQAPDAARHLVRPGRGARYRARRRARGRSRPRGRTLQDAADGALDAVPDARADGAVHGRRALGAEPGMSVARLGSPTGASPGLIRPSSRGTSLSPRPPPRSSAGTGR